MNKNFLSGFFLHRKTSMMMLSIIGVASIIILAGYASGPAKNGETVTGAPFNNKQTCSKCHSGGSYGGKIVTQLLNANKKPVTVYVPNSVYTFKVAIKKTSTKKTKYGLQTTCATAANTNINLWGALPRGLHNTARSKHNYVEQSSPQSADTFLIPWTAPPAGTGAVTFYTAGNLVNNNGSESGDQPVNTALTISEKLGPVPVVFKSFNGTIQGSRATLTWTTMLEHNIKNYTIEKSYNGTDYSAIGTVDAKGSSDYSFIDNNFRGKAYYRLKLSDNEEEVSYYNPLTLAVPDKNNYQLSFFAHAGVGFIRFHNGAQQQKVQIIYTDIQGRPLYSYITEAYEGDNTWAVQQQDKMKGITIINVITADGIKTSLKIGIDQK